jgi:hypothetical protein
LTALSLVCAPADCFDVLARLTALESLDISCYRGSQEDFVAALSGPLRCMRSLRSLAVGTSSAYADVRDETAWQLPDSLTELTFHASQRMPQFTSGAKLHSVCAPLSDSQVQAVLSRADSAGAAELRLR